MRKAQCLSNTSECYVNTRAKGPQSAEGRKVEEGKCFKLGFIIVYVHKIVLLSLVILP